MSDEEPGTKSPAQAILIDWANEQDVWVQSVVAEILETRKQMGEARIGRCYDLLLGEKGLADMPPEPAPDLTPGDADGNGEDALAIVRLHALRNVNALADGQEIPFNRRMTVLFGENGAGKSGYVRVLKSLASVRTAEVVLPNLRNSISGDSPSAKVSYELGERSEEIEWTGEKGVYPFTMLDVFDPRCVLLHVDKDLTYLYTPTDLALFRLVRQAVDHVRQRLEADRSELKPTENPFLARFVRDSTIYAKVETLGAATDLSELQSISVISEDEENQLEGLRERVDALRSGSVEVVGLRCLYQFEC